MIMLIKNKTVLSLVISVLMSLTAVAENPVTHIVKRGETIESIAKLYNVTTDELTAANPQIAKRFYTGLRIIIPSMTSTKKDVVDGNMLKVDTSAKTVEKEITTAPEQALENPNKQSDGEVDSYYGFTLSAPFEEFLKYGLGIGIEGSVNSKSWHNFGVYFAARFNIEWKPKFDLSSVNFAIGPSYVIPIGKSTSVFIPAAVACNYSITTEEDENGKPKDKTRLQWGGLISPMIVYKHFGIGLECAFGDGDPSFGMKVAFLM